MQVPRAAVGEQVRQLPAAGRHADVDEGAWRQVHPRDGAELDPQQEGLRQGEEQPRIGEAVKVHVMISKRKDELARYCTAVYIPT